MLKKRWLLGSVVALTCVGMGLFLAVRGTTDPSGAATGILADDAPDEPVTLVVWPDCNAPVKPGEFCSLDEALDQAAHSPGARIVLLPGEHHLTHAIKTSVALVAKDAPAAPTIAGIKECLLPPSQFSVPKTVVRVSSSGTKAASLVELPTAAATVLFNGIRLDFESPSQAEEKALLKVRRGRLVLANSLLQGGLDVVGDDSTLVVANTRIAAFAEGPTSVAGTLSPPAEDRHNEIPVTEGICAAAGEVGLAVRNGAEFYSVGLDVTGTFRIGVCIEGAGAHLCNGRLHDINAEGYAREFEAGWGALVHEAGQLDLEGVEVLRNLDVGVLAEGAGTLLTVRGGTSVSAQKLGGPLLVSATGVVVQDEAELILEDSTLEGNEGAGLVLSWQATATVQEALFQDNEFASIVVMGASLDLRNSTVRGGSLACNLGGGFSLWASDGEWGPNNLLVLETDFDGNGTAYHGAVLWGNEGTAQTLDVRDCTFHNYIEAPHGSAGRMGGGLFAGMVCQGLTLSGNTYQDNEGIHLFLHKSDATVSAETIATNHELDVKQQQCICGAPALDEATLQAGQAEPLTVELCDENTYDKPYSKEGYTIFLEIADIEG